MADSISLTVIVPALNEEQNLKKAVSGLIKALNEKVPDWEIILFNDGSTDRTAEIAAKLANQERRIKVIHHQRPMGIGCSFREGIEVSAKEAVTWFPGDGENDPNELLKYLFLLQHVDILNPFVINKEVRAWSRRFVSKFYLWIVNMLFGTTFNYTTGNVIYRRFVFEKINLRANSFIYQTECLVKAIYAGFTFAEVPVLLNKRVHGHSKVLTFKSVLTASWELFRLFIEVHMSKNKWRENYDRHTWQDAKERACGKHI